MSSPPPGGPPSSQQPPPYQPYPPQQPYYPQAAPPPPKKTNTALIIVIIVVVVIVVAAIAWYAVTLLLFQPVTNAQVRMTGVSWTIAYPGSTQYFGASPLTTCNGCPITLTFPNYEFNYSLTLTNTDSVAHNVTGITVSTLYFNLVSAAPDPSVSSPVAIGAGGSRTFVLTITATPLTGDHTLTGTITTT